MAPCDQTVYCITCCTAVWFDTGAEGDAWLARHPGPWTLTSDEDDRDPGDEDEVSP
jgi:hypothetical protein